MANDHDVNVDIVATDDASDVLDDVATKADTLEQTSPTVEVGADATPALRSLDDVQAEADALGHMTPRLVMETNLAEFHGEVEKAIAQAKGLDGTKVDLDTSGAESALRRVRDKSDDAQGHVKKLGGEGSVQAISDLTGPLGDVSGSVSDMGQAFTGAASVVGSAMHLSEAAVEKLGSLLAPAGIVGGIVFAFWQSWKKKAEEAKKATQETVKSIEDIGAAATAQKKVTDALHADPGFTKAAAELHLSLADMTAFISGKTVPAIDALQVGLERSGQIAGAVARGQYPDYLTAAAKMFGLSKDQAEALQDVYGSAKKVNDVLGTQTGVLHGAQGAYTDLHAVITGKFTPSLAPALTASQAVNDQIAKIEGKHDGSVVVTTNDRQVDQTTTKVNALDGRTVKVHVETDAIRVLGNLKSMFGLAAGGGGSASRGASTVADLRAFERVNGRGWRTP